MPVLPARYIFTAVLLTGLISAASNAQASVAGFYKGKKIKLIISSSPGGGYDTYGRLLAKHMGRFVPGNPSFIVENMSGKGGLKAANFVYNKAPRDGTVIAGIQRQVPFTQILGDQRAKFVASKFNWLGSLNNEVTVCVAWHKAQVRSLKDLMSLPLVVGGSGPNDTETVPAILNNTIGANFDIVGGYASGTAITIAMELGQVEGTCSSYSSLKTRNADWFKNKKVNLIIQSSTRKHPDLPDVPLAMDVAKDPATRKLLALNDARLEIGRPYLAPPGVPADRVTALRVAFFKTVKDAKFLADAKKRKRAIAPVKGTDVQALIDRVSKIDSKLIAALNEALVYKSKKAAAKIELKKINGSVIAVSEDARKVTIKPVPKKKRRRKKKLKDYHAKVSATRTLITIAGKQAQPSALKVGMTCKLRSLGSGLEAVDIACK